MDGTPIHFFLTRPRITDPKQEMKRLLILPLLYLAVACGSEDTASRLLMDKSHKIADTIQENWSFRQAGTKEWVSATVPGTVHTDLMDNGLIDNPYRSTNEPKLQWIEYEDWEYKTVFTPSKELLANKVQELVFKGLDTYADVYLNEELILQADNMFLEWRVPVTGKLVDGPNTLRVKFYSAYNTGLELAKEWPVRLPADNDKGVEYKTSVFTRKAPYHYGWDWGPRFATCGIWRPVFIEGWSTARIDNVQYIQKSISEKTADLDAIVTIETFEDGDVDLLLSDDSGNIYINRKIALKKGKENKITLPFSIPNPELWWPQGMGEPHLYRMNMILANKDQNHKLDQVQENIGLRTIELMQVPDSVGEGIGFWFEVNGQKTFMKGANYIPQDLFVPRVSDDKYSQMIDVAKESGMNMIRVWGGGIYEQDIFYDLCDSNGILVWQDFMFACSLYPWNKEFLDNVRKEAVYNVKRLRNHPSIAIWCGNNEGRVAWESWGYQKSYGWTDEQKADIWGGYETLFKKLLPEVLAAEDTTRPYTHTSPLYKEPYGQIAGDLHYWGVFHGNAPFSAYKDIPGRFSNEYGFQSPACYDTYREYFKPEDMALYSEAMVIHQKSPKGYRVIEEYMARELPLLKEDFRTYIYLSQLLHAEGIKIAMEGQRSRKPWTMGSLYWQLNDCWPVTSWSSMDSEMRWKALQFYAKRSFAPTIISFERTDSTKTATLWGITDRLERQKGTLTLTLMDFEGNQLSSEQIDVNIPANGSSALLCRTDQQLLQGANPREVFLLAQGEVAGKTMRAIYYFVPFKDLKLPKPDYTVSYAQDRHQVTATIKANKLLKSVLFEAEKLQNNPSDAYFDLLPGEEREIVLSFKGEYPVNELGIFVTNLNALVGRKSSLPIREDIK